MDKPKKRLYLASPYGFAKTWKHLRWELDYHLQCAGFLVHDPFEQACQKNVSVDPYSTMKADLAGIDKCDGVFAVINGEPPDVGVAVEIGYAAAKGKPIFLFRDDFRKCTDSERFPVNLMLLAGQKEGDWKYWIEDVEQIRHNARLKEWKSL